MLDGLVRRHVEKRSGEAERSLAAMPAPSTLAEATGGKPRSCRP